MPEQQTVKRFDFTRARKWTATTQGFLRCDAALGSTGIVAYKLGGGRVRRELRLPEEVFAPMAMDTLRSAPLTLLHPPVNDALIGPHNHRTYSIGHAGDSVRQDGALAMGNVIVQEADAIAKCMSRQLVELSPGYVCRMDESPGVHPEWGQYDVIQRGIVHNHIGLGPSGWARQGSDVSLRLDGAGDDVGVMCLDGGPLSKFIAARAKEIGLGVSELAEAAGLEDDELIVLALDGWLTSPSEEQSVLLARALDTDPSTLIRLTTGTKTPSPRKTETARMDTTTIRIDGIEYEVSKAVAPHVTKALADRDAQIAARDKSIADLTSAGSALQARHDGVAEKLAAAEKSLLEAPVRIRAELQERIALEGQARSVIGKDLKLDGADGKPKTDRQLREEMLIKLSPAVKLDGKDDAYVAARLDGLLEQRATGDASSRALGALVPKSTPEGQTRQDGTDDEVDPAKARAEMQKRNAERASK